MFSDNEITKFNNIFLDDSIILLRTNKIIRSVAYYFSNYDTIFFSTADGEIAYKDPNEDQSGYINDFKGNYSFFKISLYIFYSSPHLLINSSSKLVLIRVFAIGASVVYAEDTIYGKFIFSISFFN